MSRPPSRFFRFRPLDLDLGDVIVQIVAVALGVILGFAATAWNERNHERALLRDAIGSIHDELKSNQEGLRAVMPGHAKAAALLAKVMQEGTAGGYLPRAKVLEAFRGLRALGQFQSNVPLDIAWQIAQHDQALTLLPYQDRYSLAGVYQVQTIYYQQEQRFGETLLTQSQPSGGNYYFLITDLAIQLKVVVSTEVQLDALYTKALAKGGAASPTH